MVRIRMRAPEDVISAAEGLARQERDDMLDEGYDEDRAGREQITRLGSFLRSAERRKQLPGDVSEISVDRSALQSVVDMAGNEAEEMEKGGYDEDFSGARQIRLLDSFRTLGRGALVDVRPYTKRSGNVRGHKRRAPRRR